jgi:hypothetical protein
MKLEAGVWKALLPKPKKDLAQVHYYIEAVTAAFAESRTPEYAAAVVASASVCSTKAKLAGVATSASLVVGASAGAPVIPAGFSAAGIASAGAAGAGAAGTASAGGGIGTTALVVGGLAVAGGAVAVGVAKSGGDDSPGNGPSNTTPSGGFYTIFFMPQPPGIDVSACTSAPLTWSAQNVQYDANGNFDNVWSPSQPNTLRVVGRVTATTLQATLTCVSGARSGSISATGANGSFSGSFDFGGQRGQVTITRG